MADRTVECTGELFRWGHAAPSPGTGPSVAPSIRGKRVRSLALAGDRIAVVTDDRDGRIAWFPQYVGWKAAVAEGKKNADRDGGRAGFAADVPQTNSPAGSPVVLREAKSDALDAGADGGAPAEEENVAAALADQLGRARPSDVALGKDHVLVASDDGRVYAWGRGEEGQLGLPHAVGSVLPAEVKTISGRGVVQVAAGRAHSAAVTHDGGLYCWGANTFGQLGLGKGMPWSTVLVPRFVNAFLGVPVMMVSCGHNFTACVTVAGEVWTWGEGGCGQLGIGATVTTSNRPLLAAGVDLPLRARGIDVGAGAAAVTENEGKAGHGDEPPAPAAPLGQGFSSVACGWGHCLAVARETGDIFVWGLNAHGQLGLGDTAKRLSPTLLNVESSVGGPPVQFDDVAAGDNNSMALTRASRTMWAWGSRGRCHAADKHELRPKTVESTAGAGFGVGFVACGAKYTVAFAPTRVRKIVPAAGPTDGGSEISIIVDGVWPSDKILVKFSAILTEEEKGEVSEEDCVEIEAGTFNPDTGAVVCRTPPWPLDEAVLVEISVNGFDFTSDCVTYTFYNPPTVHGAWPPYGFMDVPTPITVYGKSIVSSSDLAVRFRSTLAPTSGNGEDEEEDDEIVDVVVPARYMGQGQVKCVAPIIDSSREVVEVAVDVAINGLDFTDAGVIFTFHGFQPISCNPCCGPRSGGSAVVIPLSPGAGEIDEDALRVKIDFGGTRTVECKAKARGGKLSFKTPKMDGTQRPPKFPSFEYTPVEEDSVVSDASSKKEETLIVDDPPPAPNVEPLPWPKGTGFLEGTIMLSVNAGLTYRTLPFVFTAYKSSPKSLVLSSAVVDSQGGVDLRILDRSLAALEASTSDPGSEEAASAAEASAREDAETTEEGSGLTTDTEENVTEVAPDAQTSAAAEDETPSDDWSGPSLKARSSEPAGSGPWLFTASETKVRFQGSALAGDGEEQGGPACSINATVDATFDGEGTITCVVPATPATEAWIEAIKEKREAGEDEDDVQPDPDADDEDGEPSKMPLRPVNFEAQVSLALDGINFEKIGTVTVLSPPLVTGIIGGGPDESFVPGMEARLVGSGFGEVGSTVSVEVSHVLSGLDFTVPGVVESVDGDESPQAAVFTFPEDINSQLVEGDPTACTCNAEISIDGGSKYSSWQTTFTASVMPPAED